MKQKERLNEVDELDLIWATNKFYGTLQTVLQNKMLVEYGFWDSYLHESSELTAKLYFATRAKMIAKGKIDENLLCEMVIASLSKD